MKYLYFVLTITLVGISCKPKDLPTVSNISKQGILIKFSHLTTKAELAAIDTKLRDIQGLHLDYSQCIFTDKNALKTMSTSLTKNGQIIANCSADLMSLQYKYYGYQMDIDGDVVTHAKAGSF